MSAGWYKRKKKLEIILRFLDIFHILLFKYTVYVGVSAHVYIYMHMRCINI